MKSNLIDYIKRIPPDREFLVTNTKKYSFGDITKLYYEIKEKYPQLEGKNCAVISSDRESLAILIPGLDAISSSLFLQAPDIEQATAEIFYQSANIQFVIKLLQGAIKSVDKQTFTCCEKSQRENHDDFLLATSGTSGVPKLASYTLSSLMSTAKSDVNKGSLFTWGLCYDINRFAGLQVYLQTIASGSKLVLCEPQDTINHVVDVFYKNKVNCMSATPSFWRKVLMVPEHNLIPLKQITLGGEISTQNVLNALLKSYQNAKITHIYASTEAGVGFAVKDKMEGFPSEYLEKKSFTGYQLKVDNGILWVKSEHGCTRFLSGTIDIDKNGFLNTGDLVKIEGQRVYFLGRDSGTINVGGNKVMPEKIEAVLEKSDFVSMAKVSSKKNPILGAIVSAEIVLKKSVSHLSNKDIKKEIINFCRDKLESFEIPAIIKFVDQIEINTTGKKIRN
ncbi:MAG: AMP-binding protein [Symbiopectobacterium sp.]|uniref:AMP-binding protein n=1 Tax=Symbiopectobacterium sp. TaxID=2952789 RepID=UPI0039E7FE65